MPCSDGGPSCYADREAEKQVDTLKVLLCSAIRGLIALKYDLDQNPALSVWWYKHEGEDLRRQAEEEAKKEREVARAIRLKFARELSKKSVSDLTVDDKKLLREFNFI